MSDQRMGTATECLTTPHPAACVPAAGRGGCSRLPRPKGWAGPGLGWTLTATEPGPPAGGDTVDTQVAEIAPDVYRLSTYVGDADIVFNQFLVMAEGPLLFHTGLRPLFPLVSAAVEQVVPAAELRWITFGHFEADE